MLELETDTIIRVITGRTIGSGDRITLAKIMESDIPRGIKVYFRADVLRSIERDFRRTPSLTKIDHNAPGYDGVVRQLLRGLTDSYAFGRDEFPGMLENAVHFVENYLCRPQWTLAGFLLQEASSSSAAEILSRLDYFADYGYFPTLIARSIAPDRTEPVSLDELRSLLTRLDDQVVRQHDGRELALLTKPIFDFLLLCDAPPHIPIPISPLLVFFDDKKMKTIREYIESIAKIRGTTELSLQDLSAILEDLYSGKPVAAPPAPIPQPPEPTEPADASPQSVAKTPAEPDHNVSAEGTASLLESARRNIPLSLTFTGLTDRVESSPPPVRPLPDLSDLMSGETKEIFVKSMFRDDLDYFDETVAELNGFQTWEQASAYLEELYELNGLLLSRSEVKQFDDMIRRRYAVEPRDSA